MMFLPSDLFDVMRGLCADLPQATRRSCREGRRVEIAHVKLNYVALVHLRSRRPHEADSTAGGWVDQTLKTSSLKSILRLRLTSDAKDTLLN